MGEMLIAMGSKSNGLSPAHPTTGFKHTVNGVASVTDREGMTKREMMAMHIMAGIMSRDNGYSDWCFMASDAVDAADALLERLERTK